MNQELMLTEEELRKYKIKKTLANVGIYTFLVIFALFIIIPFYWMFATSLRSVQEIQSTKISFFPEEWLFSNYVAAFKEAADYGIPFLKIYLNTIMVGVFSTIGTLITTVLAAFAFARLNFKGKETIFSVMLATMMIPGEIFVITNYTTVASLGWKNSYVALIVPFIQNMLIDKK